ncbi:methyltransferase [Cryptosporangium phraense]|uniref:Methyltransferase n=1 Tax=Cryptosporangium phraense TaxID=2593070 RepID=A0A545AKN2_9ACTN|nr:methyltransferase [Cryptosporangium phraense]
MDAIGVTHLGWPGVGSVEAVASAAGDDAVVLEAPSEGRVGRGGGAGSGRGRDGGGRGRDGGGGRGRDRRDRRDSRRERTVVVELPEELPETVAVVKAGADSVRGHRRVREVAAGRRWLVRADGFWQVHPAAPDALVTAVTEALAPQPGESVLDLYAGAGLFAGVLASAVGEYGRVVAVESDRGACDDARRNLRDTPWASVVVGRVDSALSSGLPEPVDLVVLDPPRSGAGAAVVRAVASRSPRAIAYVACDPAAFARDVATFAEVGYALQRVRAFDAFPMTHHVECVGTLIRS